MSKYKLKENQGCPCRARNEHCKIDNLTTGEIYMRLSDETLYAFVGDGCECCGRYEVEKVL